MALTLLQIVDAMKQPTAPTSLAIKVVTAFVLVLNASFYIAAAYQRTFLIAAIVLSVIVLICYCFWAPVGYELKSGELTVSFRIGRKRYSPVIRCSAVDAPLRAGIRVFGNGGLFAGSGIFWNRKYGLFRAYVTSCKPRDLVMVETPATKIFISPAEPRTWLRESTR
jgi:hypothetical protein